MGYFITIRIHFTVGFSYVIEFPSEEPIEKAQDGRGIYDITFIRIFLLGKF